MRTAWRKSRNMIHGRYDGRCIVSTRRLREMALWRSASTVTPADMVNFRCSRPAVGRDVCQSPQRVSGESYSELTAPGRTAISGKAFRSAASKVTSGKCSRAASSTNSMSNTAILDWWARIRAACHNVRFGIA